MHPLDRKLLRDLGTMKGQMTAVALVMVCGLAVLIMARSLILSLESTCEDFYAENRFADVFCDLKRAPNSLRQRLAEIDGTGAVETRVSGALKLDIPGMQEPADGKINSLPDDRPQQLNLLYLRTGRLPEPFSAKEIVISEAFAKAHGFQPGDKITATIYGAKADFTIVGIALSPEFVFEARGVGAVPDPKRFGVFWMNERELADAYNLNGAFNNVILRLAPGADRKALLQELDQLLEPYGGRISYDRADHFSARQVRDELVSLRVAAFAFPLVFLSISAFMTSAALTRVIRLQREQIAQLKAFGYSNFEIGLHYLKFTFVIVFVALLLGTAVGFWLGDLMVGIYHKFYHLPSLVFHPDWRAIIVALLASGSASMLGVIGAVRQAVRLPPAEAMRPEPPAEFKPSAIERIGLQDLASPAFRMALRNLERKPWQAFFTALGLTFAAAIPMVPGSLRDAIAYIKDFEWSLAKRQHVSLSLIEPGSASAYAAILKLPGVLVAEPFRTVPARIRHGHREYRLGVTGVTTGADLTRVLNGDAKLVPLPPAGVLLSEKLAELIGAVPGDTICIEVQEGRRPVIETTLNGTITDFAGVNAYMEIDALRRLLREGDTISGAHLLIDFAHWDEFLAAVKEAPQIGSLIIMQSARASFEATIADMMDTIQVIYFTFAVIVAFGVVYNSARISLSERTRDLATLRVIGFSHREVAAVLIGELALLTLLAIPVGLFFGTQLTTAIVNATSTETVRLPLVLSSRTYATSVLIVLLSSGLSFAVVSRRLKNLDLLAVLKARD